MDKTSEILNVNKYILEHKENFTKDIGLELKNKRISNNITLEEAALRSKTSTSYISQIERGIYGLSLIKFITICNAIEADEKFLEKFLFGGKENEDKLYYEFQKSKNISNNIINYMKLKKTS